VTTGVARLEGLQFERYWALAAAGSRLRSCPGVRTEIFFHRARARRGKYDIRAWRAPTQRSISPSLRLAGPQKKKKLKSPLFLLYERPVSGIVEPLPRRASPICSRMERSLSFDVYRNTFAPTSSVFSAANSVFSSDLTILCGACSVF